MTGMSLSDAPSNPPAGTPPPAPAKKSRAPLIIAGVVVLVLICGCVICGALMGPPFMAASQLPTVCQQRTGLDGATCAQWMQANQGAVSTCISEVYSTNNGASPTADQIYDCLDAKGLGPEQ